MTIPRVPIKDRATGEYKCQECGRYYSQIDNRPYKLTMCDYCYGQLGMLEEEKRRIKNDKN